MRQFQGNTFFEYFVAPTFDFIQELRTHGTDIRVREPEKLVQFFRKEAEKAYQMYCQWRTPAKGSTSRNDITAAQLPQQKNKKVQKNALFLFFFLAYDKFCQFAIVPLHPISEMNHQILIFNY